MIPDRVLASYAVKSAEEIWDSLRGGDRSALEWLYREFCPALFKLGFSLTQDRDMVQDCVQEVFLDIWNYRQSIKPTDNVKLYLYKSLYNKVNSEFKKESRKLKHRNALGKEFPVTLESIEHRMVLGQQDEYLRRKLASKLKQLPLRQNEVIQCLFFENMSYEDTAELMGINLRSVYTLAWKALSSLKKEFLGLLGVLFLY